MLNERQSKILSYISEHGEARNSDLLALTGDCSAMTLWRDLTRLEREGKIIKIRGGAAAVRGQDAEKESSFACRERQNISSKEEIARIAAGVIRSNHAYYMDAGSTVLTLMRAMHNGRYAVITSAANTAAEMARRSGCSVTLLGGQVSSNTLSCSGPQTEQMLNGMNIDAAVMATSGYSQSSGFTSGSLQEARLKRQVIGKAAFKIMLMDHSKLGRSQPFTFAALEDMDILVGDSLLPVDFIQTVRAHNVQIFAPHDGLTAAERQRILEELFLKKCL